MRNGKTVPERSNQAKWVFLCTFLFACVLFWWFPTILFRLVLDVDDPVENWALWVSGLSVVVFLIGYLLPIPRLPIRVFSTVRIVSRRLTDLCEPVAYRATLLLGIPAFLLAIQFSHYRAGVDYGAGEGIPLLHQAVLYTHMFVGFMYLGVAQPEKSNFRRVWAAAILVTLPRLIISLHWGRFFLGQAVVPIIFIALARGWVRWSAKRVLQLMVVAVAIVFVPALTRGDQIVGQAEIVRFFAAGSSLKLFQDNRDLDLTGRCPPLLVSLTAKLVPYNMFGVCTIDVSGEKGIPAVLDRILTYNDPANDGLLTGTGSNFLLELYVSGGIAMIIIGTGVFGFSCRRFTEWIAQRSLFAGIWAECLSRALFAPRSTVGYVYERIPSLVLATLFTVLVIWLLSMLGKTFRGSGQCSDSARGETCL